jgi:hypothetical protein
MAGLPGIQKKEKHTEFGVLSLEVESEGFTESYFLLAPDCHRTPLKICIGTLLLTQLIVTKKKPYSFFLIVEPVKIFSNSFLKDAERFDALLEH